MALDEIIEKIEKFTLERDWGQFHTPRNIATSISIEAAELMEIFQWEDFSDEAINSDEKLKLSVSEEIADVMIYCLRMCKIVNLNPLEIMEDKIRLNEIKYPISKSKGSSKKYNQLT